jgi:hypothetical protein
VGVEREKTTLFVDAAEFIEAVGATPPGKPDVPMVMFTVSRIDRVRKPLTKQELALAKRGEQTVGGETPTFYDQLLLTHADAHRLTFAFLDVMRDQGCELAEAMLKAATEFSQENPDDSHEHSSGGGGPGD